MHIAADQTSNETNVLNCDAADDLQTADLQRSHVRRTLFIIIIVSIVVITFLTTRRNPPVPDAVWYRDASSMLKIIADADRAGVGSTERGIREYASSRYVQNFVLRNSSGDFGVHSEAGIILDKDICILRSNSDIIATTRLSPSGYRLVLNANYEIEIRK